MKSRKGTGALFGFVILILAVVVVAYSLGSGKINFGGDAADTASIGSTGVTGALAASCDGVSSVSITYNDIDRFTPGSDAGTANLYITTDAKGSQSEGAITLTPQKGYEGLAGFASTAYFAEPVEFTTACANEDLPVELVQPGVPTITFVNSDGVTKNSDTNHEAMDADQEYTAEITIKSLGNKCSARHGALLVADYDKTYISNVEVNGLSSAQAPDYLTHYGLDNATADGFKAFAYNGELCDGDKAEYTFTITTTSTTPEEGNANIEWHWIPLNFDVNLDTLEVFGNAVAEDEDDNALTLGNTTGEFHGA